MKSKFLYISILALASSFVACEEEYKVDVPNYTFVDNLVTYDPATANIRRRIYRRVHGKF